MREFLVAQKREPEVVFFAKEGPPEPSDMVQGSAFFIMASSVEEAIEMFPHSGPVFVVEVDSMFPWTRRLVPKAESGHVG